MWNPSPEQIAKTNLHSWMQAKGFATYEEAHRYSVVNYAEFWREMLHIFSIPNTFEFPPDWAIANEAENVESLVWLPNANLNIAWLPISFSQDDPRSPIRIHRWNGNREIYSLIWTNKVALGLQKLGIKKGDAVAIDMMMTAEAVAIYLGIILVGAVVVSIADSFPPEEIAKRLRIGNAKLIFTQDVLSRGDRTIPLYDRICAANAPQAIVLPLSKEPAMPLRPGDLLWNDFLEGNGQFEPVACSPQDPINILFSSGTTGDPKAIPWDHTTPIKCASDAYWHHDLHEGDVVCWPTNLGWMMGPWLIFASLLNRCTIALYEGSPTERGFCEFVQDAKVTMLGVVPSIVKAWRKNNLVEGLDWSNIKCFSSTGEASSPDDYAWLMTAGQKPGVTKPIIEYCGGTEIGGSYISSVLIKPNEPSVFNAKVMGVDFVVLNEQGQECQPGEVGEVFIKPPSMGLSTRLLNRDHHEIYYEGCPPGLRRHGDRMRVLENGRFSSDGRADNTMNLGGIKTSSAEIEAALRGIPGIVETAAVGVPPAGGGPDRLIVFAVLSQPRDLSQLQTECQKQLSANLNPLFRIHEVKVIEALPRTASNKVMHRELREQCRN